MLAKTYAAAVNGLNVQIVTVETSVENGQQVILTGLGGEAVRESLSRVRTAFRYSNIHFPLKSITINLSPANLRKEGSGFDLPIAIGILAADEDIPTDRLGDYMLMGEIGLDGKLKPIKGALPSRRERRASRDLLCQRRTNTRQQLSITLRYMAWRRSLML